MKPLSFIFLKDFGFFSAGQVLKQDIHGDFFPSVPDDDLLSGKLPWTGSFRLKNDYVLSLPKDILRPINSEFEPIANRLESVLLQAFPEDKAGHLLKLIEEEYFASQNQAQS